MPVTEGTVSTVDPVMRVVPPRPPVVAPFGTEAEIVAVPAATAVPKPRVLTVAVRVLLEDQVAVEVTSVVVPLV